MSRKEVLAKAINKAIDGGWKPNFDIKRHRLTIGFKIEKPFEASGANWSVNDIIFNHEFARAIFGEKGKVSKDLRDWKKEIPDLELPKVNKGWQYHLQMMAIADDPIQYLGAHI